MKKESDKKQKKTIEGVVVSDKMDKTIVVEVARMKMHPKYGKRYAVKKRYKVHDAQNKFNEGNRVVFAEHRPISKGKRWTVVGKVSARGRSARGGKGKR